MRRSKFLARSGVCLALVAATQVPTLAVAAAAKPLVIGVDHIDTNNQQPQKHRVFEYTDFFSRDVSVHTGETLDFRTAPGAFHIVALSPSESAARAAYPLALLDTDDPNAIGTGDPKIQLGPSNGSITNGSTSGGGTIGDPNAFPPDNCGFVQFGQSPCTYSGGNDVESEGPTAGFGPNGPMAVDWQITINAAPGTFVYFCFIHPGMRGRFNVVPAAEDATTQAENDAEGQVQFLEDREDALEAEQAARVVKFSGGAPGTRVYHVSVGVSAAENHVAIDEMLPQNLTLDQGDRVAYTWPDAHNVHTVGFPAGSNQLPPPFGPDQNDGNEQEIVGDPGTAPPGSLLTSPSALLDAGLHVGTAYGLQPTSQHDSFRTNADTALGLYQYQCTVHDFMVGNLNVQR